ncbi:MAG: hypothetical protein ACRYGR_09635, partial [Janthinobacterium lividum]
QSGRGFTRSFQTDGTAVTVFKSAKIKAVRGPNLTEEQKEEKERIQTANKKRKRDEAQERKRLKATKTKQKTPKTNTIESKAEKIARLKQEKEDAEAEEKRKARKEFLHITDVNSTKLMEYKNNTIFIDPGRGDLLYCMHEDSTPSSKQLYRYTSNQRRKELKTKVVRDALRKRLKADPAAKAALNSVSATSHRGSSLAQFSEYLAARSAASAVLTPFFEHKSHREARWQAFRLQQQSDARLCNNLRAKFKKKKEDPDPLIVFGDHSSPNMRFHQTIRGVGMLKMLRRHKFKVLLVDEYNTSKICPGCDQVNRCFRWRCNLRPWMQNVREVHGLKQCDGCILGKTKPWNRDLVATLNFRRIVQAQREGRPRPQELQRKEREKTEEGRQKES